MTDHAPPNDPSQADHLVGRLRAHFQTDPTLYPVVTYEIERYERVNLQLALDELLAGQSNGDSASLLVGFVAREEYDAPKLSKLCSVAMKDNYVVGPVEFARVASGHGIEISTVKRGVYLYEHQDTPMAMLVCEDNHRADPKIRVEVLGVDHDTLERFVRELLRATRYGKAFRGKVLTLECDEYRRTRVNFHRVPEIPRDKIILPEDVLARVERQTVGFAKRVDQMRRAGRHIKRGLLLHGPPGTGKTLLATHLLTRMADRTSLVMTGDSLAMLETAARLARSLQPSTVLIEDVDLIGTRREHQTVGANAILFELLNQMDGVAEDCDILFILTTNQPQLLEPALAARPGRIDQAIEVPLPDHECRVRLLHLYGEGLNLSPGLIGSLATKTEGASGAFIRELLRKSTLIALDRVPKESEPDVTEQDVSEAMNELLVLGGSLTQSLLGSQIETA